VFNGIDLLLDPKIFFLSRMLILRSMLLVDMSNMPIVPFFFMSDQFFFCVPFMFC
jgi:hypothetical protein